MEGINLLLTATFRHLCDNVHWILILTITGAVTVWITTLTLNEVGVSLSLGYVVLVAFFKPFAFPTLWHLSEWLSEKFHPSTELAEAQPGDAEKVRVYIWGREAYTSPTHFGHVAIHIPGEFTWELPG